jgi:hypothetical protein
MRVGRAVGAVALTALATVGCSSGASSDVIPQDTVKLVEQGDQVAGNVTLDLCGATFASEARRRTRYQVGTANAADKSVGVATESVFYDSPQGAQQALTEVRDAQAHCPKGLTNSKVAGVPDVVTMFGPAPDAGWPEHPGIHRFAQDVTVAAPNGQGAHKLLIFQVRGSMLLGFYITPETGPAQLAPAVGGVEGLANVLAGRLAGLPAASIDA